MLTENTILSEKYKIIEKIGQGGMAEVYKAENITTGDIVAVKVLKADLCEDEKSLAKFQKEATSAASLDQENIVRVFEYNSWGDIHYIAMEYINGETLKEHLTRKGMMSSEDIIHYASCIAAALSCAHKQGIIHRDIKPQNIMVSSRGVVKVTDFGIARATTSSTLTTQHEAIGSVHYMPPEQAKGLRVDGRSDLYSLGITMYELATGEVPFDGETPVAIAIQHLNKPFPNPLEKNPDLCPGLVDCIRKLTQKDPENRYQSADELLRDLGSLEENPKVRIRYVDCEKIDDRAECSPEALKRKKTLASFAIFGIAAAALVLIFLLYNGLCNQIREKIILIPKLTEMTEEQARSVAKAAGHTFTVEGYSYSSTVKKGEIISQEPKANTETENYTTISVVLSLGERELSTVPFVVGKTYTEVFKELSEEGITFNVLLTVDANQDPGVVYKQYPEAGTSFKEGAEHKMTITVNPGEDLKIISVPSVVGQPLDQAIATLLSKDCVCGIITYEAHGSYEKGIVIAQSLNAGFNALPGASVDLTVSSGPSSGQTVTKSGGCIIISNIASTAVEHTLTITGTYSDGTKVEVYYADHVTESNFSPDGDFLTVEYPDGIVYLEVWLDDMRINAYSVNTGK